MATAVRGHGYVALPVIVVPLAVPGQAVPNQAVPDQAVLRLARAPFWRCYCRDSFAVPTPLSVHPWSYRLPMRGDDKSRSD